MSKGKASSGESKSVQNVLADLQGTSRYDLLTPNITGSAAFHAVVTSYLAGNRPPHLEWEKAHGLAFGYAEAMHATKNLVYWIAQLNLRGARLQGLDLERQYKKAQKEWRRKQEKLVKLLEKAGDLFESGQVAGDAGCGYGLKRYLDAEMPQSLPERIDPEDATNYAKKRKARIKNRIHSLAAIVYDTPVDAVFPIACPPPGTLILEDVSASSGKKTTDKISLRSAGIRTVDKLVPKNLNNRSNVIAELVTLAGCEPPKHPRQLVRSIREGRKAK